MLDEKAIQSRIETLRKNKNLSQLDVAEKMGVSTKTYQNVISGKVNLFRHLKALATILGETEEYIILGYEPVDDGKALRLEVNHEADLRTQREVYEAALKALRLELTLAQKDVEMYKKLYEDKKQDIRVMGQIGAKTIKND